MHQYRGNCLRQKTFGVQDHLLFLNTFTPSRSDTRSVSPPGGISIQQPHPGTFFESSVTQGKEGQLGGAEEGGVGTIVPRRDRSENVDIVWCRQSFCHAESSSRFQNQSRGCVVSCASCAAAVPGTFTFCSVHLPYFVQILLELLRWGQISLCV